MPGTTATPGSTAPGHNEHEKRLAAEAAATLVQPGAVVGLGTGSTAALLLPALARRSLDVVCVATSPATGAAATALGLDVRPFEGIDRIDIAIDGADEVDDRGWLVKGGGGAQTREKIVAAAARTFVVIVSSDKLRPVLQGPVPLELAAFGVDATLRSLGDLGRVRRRDAPPTPDGGVLADLWPDGGPGASPGELARRLDAEPGLVSHGLFPPELTSLVIIGTGDGVVRRAVEAPPG